MLSLGWSIVYIKESPVIISEFNCILSLKMDFVLEISVDLDKCQVMPYFIMSSLFAKVHC